MTGKLVALNTSTFAHVWPEDFTVTTTVASGFGCSATSVAVAIYGTPAVAGDLVYFGGYNGKIYALNASLGALRWVYPREGSIYPIVGGVVISGGKVYFGDADGEVYALDSITGDRQWEFQAGDKIWSTPTVSGDTLFIGCFDKKLYALNAADGTKKWEFLTEGAIVSSPAVYDNTVYVGSFDRHLYAINADGSLKWKSDFIAGKWFWAGLVVRDNLVYAPNLDGKVYVLNAQTGEKVAAPDLGAPISSSPVTIGNLVIVVTEKGAVYGLDTSNKATIITSLKTPSDKEEQIYAPLYASDGVVYIHTQTKQYEAVYVLRPETGEMPRRIPVN
jgi:outer membrane protein assembly factor BamB